MGLVVVAMGYIHEVTKAQFHHRAHTSVSGDRELEGICVMDEVQGCVTLHSYAHTSSQVVSCTEVG